MRVWNAVALSTILAACGGALGQTSPIHTVQNNPVVFEEDLSTAPTLAVGTARVGARRRGDKTTRGADATGSDGGAASCGLGGLDTVPAPPCRPPTTFLLGSPPPACPHS